MILKTKLLTFFIGATLVLSSCAIQTGIQSNSTELSQGNFEFIELVSAEAEASYFLGIGGLKKKALVLEAKKRLYAQHPLSKGQAYANISIDYENLYVLLYTKRTCIVSADIVQFEVDEPDTLQQLFKALSVQVIDSPSDSSGTGMTSNSTNPRSFISDNDSVLFLKGGNAIAGKVETTKNGIATILYLHNETEKKAYQDITSVFKKENLLIKFRNGSYLSTGDTVFYGDIDHTTGAQMKNKATLLGLNNTHALLLQDSGKPRIELLKNIFLR